MAKFKVGDKVKFELSKGSVPRWDFGSDGGETGKFTTGEVNESNSDEFHITFDNGGSRMGWNFNYLDQDKPGFPVLFAPNKEVATKFKVGDVVTFEMNKDATQPRWNMGTDCGPSGKFATGKVTEMLASDGFHVDYKVNATMVAGWNFTFKDQGKPGFPVLTNPSKEQLEGADALKRWLTNDRS